jgi:peptidoglycan glycosyltransferase
VNRFIARLFGLVVLLFALLVAFTSRWTVFQAAALRANPLNVRGLIEELRIPRGDILADDGTVLAHSVRGSGGIYRRTYPQQGLFAHAVGYDYISYGKAGLEREEDGPLTGAQSSGIDVILNQLRGRQRVGNNVVTSLDPSAQRVALRDLAGRPGAVVALNPQTGAVKVFASDPGYDPTQLASTKGQASIGKTSGEPLFDRVTEAGYPPGSTFKVVTAIAAIDSGRFTPSSTLSGKSPIIESGTPLSNDGNEQYGDINLTTALTFSVNTVWAQVAEQLGKARMGQYMTRLGFGALPPIDLPSGELRASGEYDHGHVIPPTSDLVDVGRLGIGQDRLEVTPLQMAMVAAAVADGGRMMAPHLVTKVVDPTGRTVQTVDPQQLDQAFSPQTATAVTGMMAQVVKEGTGTAAALTGVDVAGKTGTAQIAGTDDNQVWFIAFAPIDHPTIAIAATLERSPGSGGPVVGPIARDVIQQLLHDE